MKMIIFYSLCWEEEIVDKFRDVYAALYNSAGSQTDMLELRQKIRQLIGPCSVAEVAKITGKVVKEAEAR